MLVSLNFGALEIVGRMLLRVLLGGIRYRSRQCHHFLDHSKIVKIEVARPSHEVSWGLPSVSPSGALSLGEFDRLRSIGLDLATGGDVDGGEAVPS